MAAIDKAALALTQCWTCLGCNRLEDDVFRGDNKCKADVATLVERKYGEQQEIGESGN
jgi:hypothetical protein